LDEIVKKSKGRVPATTPITEEFRVAAVKFFAEEVESSNAELESVHKKLAKSQEEQSKLPVENLAEQRRISDVRAKFTRLLANVDLLVVPRFTLVNLIEGQAIPADIHALNSAHIDAIKDFMKAGKPVLFLLGPPVNARGDDLEEAPNDSLENLLAE